MESNSTFQLKHCRSCYQSVTAEDAFCEGCGYPLKGTEFEQKNFMFDRSAKEIDLEDAKEKIRKAGNVLYWIAGATVLSGLILFVIGDSKNGNRSENAAVLLVYLILALIYVVLASWSKKKPFAAIVSGLSLYVIVIVFSAIVDPATIVQGIVIKCIFIGYFIKGIRSAMEAENIKKELNIE